MKYSRAILLPLVAVLLLGACQREKGPPHLAQQGDSVAEAHPADGRPECEHRTDDANTLALSGAITGIPEFHDCQRLIVTGQDGRDAYGPLVGIWVSAGLRFVRFPGDTLDLGRNAPDTTYGSYHVETIAGVTVPTAVVGASGVPVATIENFDRGPYAPLGIAPGWNCLYILSETAAKMVSGMADHTACRVPWNAGMGGTDLSVVHHAGKTEPVGRWAWNGRVQFVVMACPNGWCEVGPADGFTSEGFGWGDAPMGDRQSLAEKVGSALRVTSVTGSIDPVANLGRLKAVDFKNRWVHVGVAALDRNHAKYNGRGHRLGAPRTAEDSIYFCGGTAAKCNVMGNPAMIAKCEASPDPDTGQAWWTRIISTRGSDRRITDHCTVRRAHVVIAGVEVPGAARWRWLKEDEGFWIRCGNGCCSLEET